MSSMQTLIEWFRPAKGWNLKSWWLRARLNLDLLVLQWEIPPFRVSQTHWIGRELHSIQCLRLMDVEMFWWKRIRKLLLRSLIWKLYWDRKKRISSILMNKSWRMRSNLSKGKSGQRKMSYMVLILIWRVQRKVLQSKLLKKRDSSS